MNIVNDIKAVKYLKSNATTLEKFKKIRQRTFDLYSNPERGTIVSELQAQGINIFHELIVASWQIA